MFASKTTMCRNYNTTKGCPYGSKCRFAHGSEEVSPCWYYNNGGCFKSAKECVYRHVKAETRKPLHVQRPCNESHCVGRCTRDDCTFDHFELTKQEWNHHYPNIRYPGRGYKRRDEKRQKNIKTKAKVSFEQQNIFDVLATLPEPQKPQKQEKPQKSQKQETPRMTWADIAKKVSEKPLVELQKVVPDAPTQSWSETAGWLVDTLGLTAEDAQADDHLVFRKSCKTLGDGMSWADMVEKDGDNDDWLDEEW